jgi:hypothetical protein
VDLCCCERLILAAHTGYCERQLSQIEVTQLVRHLTLPSEDISFSSFLPSEKREAITTTTIVCVC